MSGYGERGTEMKGQRAWRIEHSANRMQVTGQLEKKN